MESVLSILLVSGTVLTTVLSAADLNLTGQSGRTYENGIYDRLIISNSNNITIRNCSFGAVGTGAPVSISGSDSIIIEDCDIDGKIDACNCVNIENNSSHVTVKHCIIHDAADDGMSVWNVSDIRIEGNTICHLYGCGTDGGCGPCYNGHSDGIELVNSENVVIEGNLIFDVRSTGAVFMGGGETFCRNVVMTNNIFYTPENAITVYVQNVAGAALYNNIIWKGHWHGLAVGAQTTDLTVKNNIIRSIDFTHLGGTYDAAEHDIDYNVIAGACRGYSLNTHDVWDPYQRFAEIPNIYVSTSYTEVEPVDFNPLAEGKGIDAGWSGTGVPAADFYGNPRTGTGTDIGPIEFTGTTGVRHPSVRDDGTGIRFSPNPFDGNTGIACGTTFRNGVVRIYSPRNRLVRTVRPRPGTTTTWRGDDDAGNRLPRGMYLAVAEHDGSRATGTVIIK